MVLRRYRHRVAAGAAGCAMAGRLSLIAVSAPMSSDTAAIVNVSAERKVFEVRPSEASLR